MPKKCPLAKLDKDCIENQCNLYDAVNAKCYLANPRGKVQKIIAGSNITISPPDGIGEVTINATGGGGGPTVVKKTDDQSNSTTTLADVTDMAFTLAANTIYVFEFIIAFQTAATTTGIRLDITGPTSPNYIVWWREIPLAADVAGTDNIQDRQLVTYQSDAATASIGVANRNYIARITGVISNGANSGTLKLQFASEVSGSAVTIKKGSFGRLWV